ncbi:nitrite reductase (NAD(P)H) small subunit [Streptomyces sp. NPDC054863]
MESGRRRVAFLSGAEGGATLFRDASGEVRAVGNRDSLSGGDVLADGSTGTVDGCPVVASPMHEQVFGLLTRRVP